VSQFDVYETIASGCFRHPRRPPPFKRQYFCEIDRRQGRDASVRPFSLPVCAALFRQPQLLEECHIARISAQRSEQRVDFEIRQITATGAAAEVTAAMGRSLMACCDSQI
jgi:hypothetical protein